MNATHTLGRSLPWPEKDQKIQEFEVFVEAQCLLDGFHRTLTNIAMLRIQGCLCGKNGEPHGIIPVRLPGSLKGYLPLFPVMGIWDYADLVVDLDSSAETDL